MLTLNGTTAEDLALQWLANNDTLALVPTSDDNRARLRQRFALLTWGYKATTKAASAGYEFMELKWDLTAPNECDWFKDAWDGFQCDNGQVTKILGNRITGTLPPDLSLLTALQSFEVVNSAMVGTIPSSVGLWTNLTYFGIADNSMQGTIPSSIGAWTAMNNVDISNNKFTGTIPTTVSAWTALRSGYFSCTNLTGVMPTFGGGFCPKQGIGRSLVAYCKIVCECCSFCA
jgi:hypothetical protein